ncbi:MAG: ABC-2 family transporter protein [Methanocella sp. PtaU1.Bin125]|nr:MAG: ABC-2 family transporter protein [Methanocella sp. PtaU1.Bin125]
MRPELIVAGKEFRDHVTSKRFIVIFTILLLFSIYSIGTGMDQYNKTLDMYKQNQQQDWYQQEIARLQQEIQAAQARGDSQDLIDSLQAQLDSMLNPWMPSVMTIFYTMNQYFVWICILLAIALGFDLITREKEEGSLKSLLSHPVYRDSVINGKTIAAISVLAVAMGATLLITIAVMLFFSVIPTADELLRITAYYVMALGVCVAFFAVAMAASTLAKNSSMAVMFTLGVVVILAGLSNFSPQIVSFIVGPAPDYGGPIVYRGAAEDEIVVKSAPVAGGATAGDSGSSPVDSSTPPDGTPAPTIEPIKEPEPVPPGPIWDNSEWQKWWDRQMLVQSVFDAISPITNFQNHIAQALISDTSINIRPLLMDSKISPYYRNEKTNVLTALGSVWMNILALVAEIIAALGVAYVKFLRTDIR